MCSTIVLFYNIIYCYIDILNLINWTLMLIERMPSRENLLSVFRKSCIMGWRLFAIIACYCDCTEALRPYLFKFLETTASDTGRTYSGAASICLQNLRKTFKYGGRKNVPLTEEISALAVSSSTTKSGNWCFKICINDSDQFDMIYLQNGRISKRFAFIFSGCEKEGMVQIKPCTVCTLYMLVSPTLSTLFSLNIAP